MHSLYCRSCLFVWRCPLTQAKSITRLTYSHFKTSAGLSSTELRKNNKVEDPFKRNYVSLGGRKNKDFNIPNINLNNIYNRSKQLFKEVQLNELSKAPQPAFWYGVSGLAPFVLPPLSFLLIGYSPFLASAQLTYGATICSFLGGIKWGYALTGKADATWKNLGWAVVPQLIAWLGLLVPQTLGFIVVSGSLFVSVFTDLTMFNYPNWFRAMRLCLTIPAILSLLLMAIISLFH